MILKLFPERFLMPPSTPGKLKVLCVNACGFVHVTVGARGSGRRAAAPDPLELKIKTFTGSPMWVSGTEFRFPGRAVCTLNHKAISPAPGNIYFKKKRK